MSINLDRYLIIMYEEHNKDITALEKYKDRDVGITFKTVTKNAKRINIDGSMKKILYVGNKGFRNVFNNNNRLIIYKR